MTRRLLFALVFVAIPTLLSAGPASTNDEVAVDDPFDRAELGKGWHVNTGEWKIVDGVVKAREIAEDKHSAAARRIVETGDATYEFRFRFTKDGKAFHFGFDPVRGALKKRGHLFSVIVTPESWKLMKHVDKDRPKEDPNEILAHEKSPFEPGQWYRLRVTTSGIEVTAEIAGKGKLEASHETFGVRKPTLVFRCVGDGVEIDDLRVWTEKES